MTNINSIKSLVVLACLFGFAQATAQFIETAKIVSDNRESRAEYGTSVAINDNFAIVGASRETFASGAAYVYVKDNQGDWSYSQRLAATDPNEGAEFGGGAKFSEDYLVVAAGRADVGGTQRAGALYVYNYVNNNWEFGTKLIASDMTNDAKLGMNPTSMDVEGNTIVSGAPGENVWTGSVYVFTKEGGTWTETQKILSPIPQEQDVFGVGVALSGNYLVVGANEVDGRKGAVYVYLKDNNGLFQYVQTLMASDAANNDFFGTSVSIAGDQMVVGAYGASNEQGAAYIFERDNQGSWTEVQKLTGNTSSESTHFGWSTDIQQDFILASAPHVDGLEAGEVYFYKRENSGTWLENQVLQGNDTVGEDFYGWCIAMHQEQLIVGAPWEDEDANGGNTMDRAGSAYIFRDPNLLGAHSEYDGIRNISFYPNPSQHTITFKSIRLIASVQLYGTNGALLKETQNLTTPHYILNIANISKGIYFVNVVFDDGSKTIEKIVKY